MESGEVLDLGELARQVAGSHGASDPALRRQRVADAAQQVRTSRSKNLLSPAIVNSAPQPHMQLQNWSRDDCRRLAMTSGYIVADVAIKTAYFSLVAAAFIFVSMLLLAGVHP
jgi:hypothetical protein